MGDQEKIIEEERRWKWDYDRRGKYIRRRDQKKEKKIDEKIRTEAGKDWKIRTREKKRMKEIKEEL